MEFNNDELSLVYVMSKSYTEKIKEEIAVTSKKKSNYNRLISLKNSSVALTEKLRVYLSTQGISFENDV